MHQVYRAAIILFLVLCSLSLLLLSFSSAYAPHLRSDINTFAARAGSFLMYGDLAHLAYNEYQPGAILFFLLLSPALLISQVSFVFALYAVNLLLIFVLAWLIYRFTKSYLNVALFNLVILFTGPIVLHRFELFVFLWVALSIIFFERKKYVSSGICIAASILIKVFPVVMLPYFVLFLILSDTGWKRSIARYLGGVLLGSLGILFFYAGIFHGDLYKILIDFNNHSLKPIHIESIWASILSIYDLYQTGTPPAFWGAYGISGINDTSIILPKFFYNYIWVAVVGIFYAAVFAKMQMQKHARTLAFDLRIPYAAILILLTFSKVLAPQYFLWATLLFCLIEIPRTERGLRAWVIDIFLILAMGTLSMIVYPLNYSGLEALFKIGTHQDIFWIMTARNTLLVTLTVRTVSRLFKRSGHLH